MKFSPPIPANILFAGRSLADPQFSPDGSLVTFITSAGDMSQLAFLSPEDGLEQWLPLHPAIKKGTGTYGWLPGGDGIIYLGVDGCLHRFVFEGSVAQPITRQPDAISALSVSPDGTQVAYVVDTQHVAIVPTAGDAWPRRISSDADFAFDPTWSPDSQTVAWHEWDVPDMPWDGGRNVARRTDGNSPIVTVFEREDVAVQQPHFSPDSRYLSFLCDADGWLNVWTVDATGFENPRPLIAEPFEHAPPAWGPGQRSYAWTQDATSVVYTRNDKGLGRLRAFDVVSGESRHLVDGTFSALSAWNAVVGLHIGPQHGLTLDVVDVASGASRSLARGPVVGVERLGVEPEAVSWDAEDGATIHGRLYRTPRSSGSEAPPLIVWLHGGPTGQSPATLYERWNYLLDRGWSVLVVDYRGSTGWGRQYAQAMRGRWGEIDVSDTLAGVKAAIDRGWGHPEKIVPFGGSSAGTTILLMLAQQKHLFPAAIVLYPVVDLVEANEDTWRFEAHYFHSLLGPLSAAYDDYVERSPITHVNEISTPLLLLHGDADIVVPVDQSVRLAEALKRVGCVVEFHLYEGEGHGWRKTPTQIDELQRIETFLTRHVLHKESFTAESFTRENS